MKICNFDQYSVICRKLCELGYNLLLFINKKLHAGFVLEPRNLKITTGWAECLTGRARHFRHDQDTVCANLCYYFTAIGIRNIHCK